MTVYQAKTAWHDVIEQGPTDVWRGHWKISAHAEALGTSLLIPLFLHTQ